MYKDGWLIQATWMGKVTVDIDFEENPVSDKMELKNNWSDCGAVFQKG